MRFFKKKYKPNPLLVELLNATNMLNEITEYRARLKDHFIKTYEGTGKYTNIIDALKREEV